MLIFAISLSMAMQSAQTFEGQLDCVYEQAPETERFLVITAESAASILDQRGTPSAKLNVAFRRCIGWYQWDREEQRTALIYAITLAQRDRSREFLPGYGVNLQELSMYHLGLPLDARERYRRSEQNSADRRSLSAFIERQGVLRRGLNNEQLNHLRNLLQATITSEIIASDISYAARRR